MKTEEDQNYINYYWTLDGEHIFYVQKKPKGENRKCGKPQSNPREA
jgi:hypothetical protein